MFLKNASPFQNSDLAHRGECIVCLAKSGKHVAGSAKHTVIHNGLRYQFPSENEAKMFRSNPAQFVAQVAKMQKVSKTSAVRISGRSGCAGCEFGVKPLGSPNELGLAIVSQDGRVIVVENAHKQYPAIYKARFNSKQLVVEGTVLKTQGKFAWIRPTSLKSLN